MSEQEKLLPCPFCGGDATLMLRGTQPEVSCEGECGISYSIQVSDYFTQDERFGNPNFAWFDKPHYQYAQGGIDRAAKVLTEFWNTRTTPPADKDVVERVARAICKADMVLPDEYGVAGKPRWTQYERKANAALAAMPNHSAGVSNMVEKRKDEMITRIFLLCQSADGWEGGETFYKSTITTIREELEEFGAVDHVEQNLNMVETARKEGIKRGLENLGTALLNLQRHNLEESEMVCVQWGEFVKLADVQALIEKEG